MRTIPIMLVFAFVSIVLEPADEYIQNFVKDVNRGRVIRVESVIPHKDAVVEVNATDHLETAARSRADSNLQALNWILT